MLKNANTSFMLGTSSWREQFVDALTVSAGIFFLNLFYYLINELLGNEDESDKESEDGEIISKKSSSRKPSLSDYIMYKFF